MIQSSAKKVLCLLPLLAAGALPLCGAEHKQPPVQPASSFAAVETHASEKLAIAAEPYDTQEKEAIFRVDYLRHGILPIRLIVTNLGDQPISLREARILFETASGERIQAAEPEDVERRMTLKEKTGTKLPLPGPLSGIKTKPKASNKAIEQDFSTFEYSALTVEPHTTRAGFLFYDVSGLTHPLRGAKLHLRKLRNSEGKELFFFEIPFDKYLQSKSDAMD